MKRRVIPPFLATSTLGFARLRLRPTAGGRMSASLPTTPLKAERLRAAPAIAKPQPI